MDIHKPKPWRDWREFLKEIGTIVIGVLIALAAEQVVEALHWRHMVRVEREALDCDVGDMWSAMSARVVVQPCVDRRLDELALVFTRHEHGQPLGIVGSIGRPTIYNASTNALQMASADGSLSHMSTDDKQAYFGVQSTYQFFATSAFEERDSWRALQALNDPTALDDGDWRDLRRAYRNVVDSNRTMKFNLVFGDEAKWLTPFQRFPRMPPTREALAVPVARDLCRPAVKR